MDETTLGRRVIPSAVGAQVRGEFSDQGSVIKQIRAFVVGLEETFVHWAKNKERFFQVKGISETSVLGRVGTGTRYALRERSESPGHYSVVSAPPYHHSRHLQREHLRDFYPSHPPRKLGSIIRISWGFQRPQSSQGAALGLGP